VPGAGRGEGGPAGQKNRGNYWIGGGGASEAPTPPIQTEIDRAAVWSDGVGGSGGRRGGGRRAGLVRVGPLRTSVSGAGTAWADCPSQMALRAAGAAGLTIGWARVGVTLEKGGPPPVSPLPDAWAPETVVPLRG